MKTERSFEMFSDRYKFDFGECSIESGFAQVDTGQDASYFGTWANPFSFSIVCYCEGDVTRETAECSSEFCAALRDVKRWNDDSGHGFKGIDPGFNVALEAQFVSLGLSDLFHPPLKIEKP